MKIKLNLTFLKSPPDEDEVERPEINQILGF